MWDEMMMRWYTQTKRCKNAPTQKKNKQFSRFGDPFCIYMYLCTHLKSTMSWLLLLLFFFHFFYCYTNALDCQIVINFLFYLKIEISLKYSLFEFVCVFFLSMFVPAHKSINFAKFVFILFKKKKNQNCSHSTVRVSKSMQRKIFVKNIV